MYSRKSFRKIGQETSRQTFARGRVQTSAVAAQAGANAFARAGEGGFGHLREIVANESSNKQIWPSMGIYKMKYILFILIQYTTKKSMSFALQYVYVPQYIYKYMCVCVCVCVCV